jgi:hypothetical protein
MYMPLSLPYRVLIAMAAVLAAATVLVVSHASQLQRQSTDASKAARAPAATPVGPPGKLGRTPAQPRHSPPHAANRNPASHHPSVSTRVAHAVRMERVVVLLFSAKRGAEDAAARAAVRALPRSGRTAVFQDDVTRVARYRRVIPTTGINRSPAILIIGRDHRARIIEGYIDPDSLRQSVRDAGR